MASYRKNGKTWEAQIAKHGIRKSRSFDTKAEAVAWATIEEAAIMAGKRGEIPDKNFGDLLTRYRDEISVIKRGERWESARIGLILRDAIAVVQLDELDATHVAGWRDRRLAEVSPASVRREWTLLSHACTIAIREWKWLRENPFREVRRPKPPSARDRLITPDEIERLLFALGYEYDVPPKTQTARVGAALLFAIETAMRAGEICALHWEDVDIDRCFLRVRGTEIGGGKTDAARRDVPLSTEALRILRQLQDVKSDGEPVFRISSTQNLDASFRRAKTAAQIQDLHFHDSRHAAITSLAKKLTVLPLARMVGHRDLRMLQVYYNEHASDMATRLG